MPIGRPIETARAMKRGVPYQDISCRAHPNRIGYDYLLFDVQIRPGPHLPQYSQQVQGEHYCRHQ